MQIVSFNTSDSAIAKNAGLGFILQFLIKFKGIIILPIIVHFLPKEVIGEWRIITTTVSILLPLISLNLFDGSGMFFSADVDKDSVRNKYFSVFNVTLMLEAGALLLAFLFKLFYSGPYADILLLVALYFAALYNYKLSIMLLEAYQKSSVLMWINLAVEYGGVLVSLLLIALGYRDIRVFLIPPVLFFMSAAIFMFIQINREIPYQLHIDRAFVRKTLPVSISLLPVFLAEWVLSAIGVYAVRYFLGETEVGFFSILLSLASLILSLRATLQFFWFSTCSHMIQNGDPGFPVILKRVIKAYLLLIVLALECYGFFSHLLLVIMANGEYTIVDRDMFIFVLGNALMVFSCIWNGILYARKEGVRISSSYLAAGAVTALLSPLLVRFWGMTGACVAYFVGNVILFFSMFLSLRGKLDIRFTPSERRMTVFLLALVPFFLLVKMLVPVSYKLYIAGLVFLLFLVLLNEFSGYFPIRDLVALIKRK